MSTPEPGSEPTFEQARAELERVVQRLEDGSTTLEEALALWERGEELYRFCRARLDEAEARIAKLGAAIGEGEGEGEGESEGGQSSSGIGPT